LGLGDCPDISDATEIIRSLEIRGRHFVGCLKNNLDSTFNRNHQIKIAIIRNNCL